MKNRLLKLTLLALAVLLVPRVEAQVVEGFQDPDTEKLAQTGMKFLSVSVDPRAAAMGDALTAEDVGSSIAMLYNPAGMARLQNNIHVGVMQAQWIGEIDYNAGTIAFAPQGGIYGVFGVSVIAVDYGDFIGTIRADNDRGYEDIGNFSPTALSVGVGYARALTDRFAVGGNAKFVKQDLGSFPVSFDDNNNLVNESYDISTVAFDFGVLYHTGFRSLSIAMSARNFSQELQYEEENFELPLTFRIGATMNVLDFTNMNTNMHSLRVSVDAERPRDFSEQVKVGAEYLFMNTLALRAGHGWPTDERGVNLGVGLQRDIGTLSFAFNYAYTEFGVFDNVNRLGVQLGF